jgi:hypothetical protein
MSHSCSVNLCVGVLWRRHLSRCLVLGRICQCRPPNSSSESWLGSSSLYHLAISVRSGIESRVLYNLLIFCIRRLYLQVFLKQCIPAAEWMCVECTQSSCQCWS